MNRAYEFLSEGGSVRVTVPRRCNARMTPKLQTIDLIGPLRITREQAAELLRKFRRHYQRVRRFASE